MAGLRRARANDRPRQRPTGPGSSRGSRPSRGFPARTPYSRWTRRAGGLRATHFTKSLRPITWSRSKPSAPPRVEALGRAEIELPPVAESTNKGHVFHAAPALAAGSGAREATGGVRSRHRGRRRRDRGRAHRTRGGGVRRRVILRTLRLRARQDQPLRTPVLGGQLGAVPCVGRPAPPGRTRVPLHRATSNTTSDSEPLLSPRGHQQSSAATALRRDFLQI